ncbi:MAG TPA: hypothetical protein PK694_02520 [Rhodospirillales bacterium]|nr:hypothetical protein [Rhodospirillales bacterium]
MSVNPGDEAEPGTPGSGDAPCPKCAGSGKLEGKECPNCGGTGIITEGVGGA